MKTFFILAVFIGAAIFAPTLFAQEKWTKYENARFGYSIAYPSDLLTPQGEADNGDGQVFKSDKAEMRVYGSNLLLSKTLSKEFDAVVKQHENVAYKLLRKNFFVVSGTNEKRIFYQKTIAKPNGAFVTFYIEYAADERAEFDKIVTKIAASFK